MRLLVQMQTAVPQEICPCILEPRSLSESAPGRLGPNKDACTGCDSLKDSPTAKGATIGGAREKCAPQMQ